MTMAILLSNSSDNAPWRAMFEQLLPNMTVYEYGEKFNAAHIRYAAVWDHPHGDLATYPNLNAIMVLGSGTDHLDTDPTLPRVPVVRLIDPQVVNDMALYSLYWIIHFQRDIELYRAQQQQSVWHRHDARQAHELSVTVFGLGDIGAQIAQRISSNGYRTYGWNRSEKNIEGVECHSYDQLNTVLQKTDIVVNCLPFTEQTRHLFNAERLALLPQGSYMINPGRGDTIDDNALLTALESGHIAGAALDAFTNEPLEPQHPFWRQPGVFITPHIAGATYARSAARVIIDNILRIEHKQQPDHLYIPPQHRH